MARTLVVSALALVLLASPALAVPDASSSVSTTDLSNTAELEAAVDVGYSETPQSSGAETAVGTSAPSTGTISEVPPEPEFLYIDNLCGMVPGDIGGRDAIFDDNVSGCLLGFRPAQAPGWRALGLFSLGDGRRLPGAPGPITPHPQRRLRPGRDGHAAPGGSRTASELAKGCGPLRSIAVHAVHCSHLLPEVPQGRPPASGRPAAGSRTTSELRGVRSLGPQGHLCQILAGPGGPGGPAASRTPHKPRQLLGRHARGRYGMSRARCRRSRCPTAN